ncbi:MAG: DNA alkylation repair protein, partial [Bacteroidia bacterium]
NAEEVALLLWKEPERELHYFAMELLEKQASKAPENRLKIYEKLITSNSWWDTVDFISPHLCGVHFRKYPHLCNPAIERWINSNNIWLQRSAILFQLGYKKETNQEMLFDVCSRLAAEPDFFIRKAIGWALRQYARTVPAAVKLYVQKAPLSALSRKEALKHF